jgi:aconitase A
MGTGKEKESNTANHFEDSMCRNTKQKSSIRKSLVQVNRNFEGQSNPLQITN